MITTEYVNCASCGANDKKGKASFEAIDRLHGVTGSFRYQTCGKCGLLYQSPRVSPEEAYKLYPQNYQPHQKATSLAQSSTVTGLLDRIKDFLHYNLMNGLKGTRLRRDVFAGLGPQSRVLDVGCGSGEFLAYLKRARGCQVLGVDLAAGAVETAAGLGVTVQQGQLLEQNLPTANFDLVTAWWYLEHVPNPEDILLRMRDLTKKGGSMVVAVPNSRSLNALLFRSYWYHLDCPRHYHLWTPKLLVRKLKALDLDVTEVKYDKSPWGLLGSLQYVLLGNNHSEKVRNKIRGNMFLALLLLPFTLLVGLLHGGDTMIVYCRKR